MNKFSGNRQRVTGGESQRSLIDRHRRGEGRGQGVRSQEALLSVVPMPLGHRKGNVPKSRARMAKMTSSTHPTGLARYSREHHSTSQQEPDTRMLALSLTTQEILSRPVTFMSLYFLKHKGRGIIITKGRE